MPRALGSPAALHCPKRCNSFRQSIFCESCSQERICCALPVLAWHSASAHCPYTPAISLAIVMGNTTAGRKLNSYLFDKKQNNENDLRNPNEIEACRKLGLLIPDEAQYTMVHKISKFLSDEEIEDLKQAIKTLQQDRKVGVVERIAKGQSAKFNDCVWRTSFLHTNGHFKSLFPSLHAKIKGK